MIIPNGFRCGVSTGVFLAFFSPPALFCALKTGYPPVTFFLMAGPIYHSGKIAAGTVWSQQSDEGG